MRAAARRALTLAPALLLVLAAAGCGPGSWHWADDGPGRDGGVPAHERRRDLGWDEAQGGHTLARHVGLSDAALGARLAREPIAAASTFPDRDTAERVVGAALAAAEEEVGRWEARQGRRPNLVVPFKGEPDAAIGRTLRRGERGARRCATARIVLRWDEPRTRFYVLTAYPDC